MKQITLFLILLAMPCIIQAQKDEKAIKAVINRFFEAMEKGDTTALLSTCMPDPVFQTYMKEKNGELQMYTENFSDFVRFLGSPRKDTFKEEVKFEAIHSEMSLASAWTPYTFYLNGKVSHCGTNSFQLVKTAAGWKIQYIIDTRRKGCK
ncbi:MAG: hypothetical protein RIR11_474 [Bacteroidota bacterium]|jgi:hypothetical protein